MMSRLPLFAFLSTIAISQGFYPTFQGHTKHAFILMGGFFDFEPVHGKGSAGEGDLDEQWEVQQKILAERRGHLDKAHLRKKYNTPQKLELGGKTSLDKKIDLIDDMIIDEPKGKKKAVSKAPKFKMPWDK